MKTVLIAATVLAALSGAFAAADADGLSTARKALRDGLWDVARRRAESVGGPEAALVKAESFAREERWKDLLDSIPRDAGTNASALACYEALALERLGRPGEAEAALKGAGPDFAKTADALRARIALDAGDAAKAAEFLSKAGLAEGGATEKMLAAEILAARGDAKGAEKLYRAVAEDPSSGDAETACAAIALGDAAAMRAACARIVRQDLKCAVTLRLGLLLQKDEATFDEGAATVASVAKEYPQTEGAMEAYAATADAFFGKGRGQEAADAYRTILETWPEASKSPSIHEGRAFALMSLGKNEEALEAFERFGETAEDGESKARALAGAGDALSKAGRQAEAIEKYRAAVAGYPSTAAGKKLAGIVELHDLEKKARELYDAFRFREAMKIFETVAAKDPSRKPRMDYFRMLCLYGMVKDDEAAGIAAKLAAGSQDAEVRAEAALWLAKFFYNARRWTDASALFASYATNMAPESAFAPEALLWASRAALAAGEFKKASALAAQLASERPSSPEAAAAGLVRGEALTELSRLDEAIVVLGAAAANPSAGPKERLRAKMLKADALFVMGADNPSRYREALGDYRTVLIGETLDAAGRISVSFKIARTLDKLGRTEEAIDQYYADVVCAYEDARLRGERFDDETKAAFARAVFRLADEFESRGDAPKAAAMLEHLAKGGAGVASKEASRRLRKMHEKGLFR